MKLSWLFIRNKKKKILEKIAGELGEVVSKRETKKIYLHGAKKNILDFFGEEIKKYFALNQREVVVAFGKNGSYNLNVGYFLNAYRTYGMNPHYLIEN